MTATYEITIPPGETQTMVWRGPTIRVDAFLQDTTSTVPDDPLALYLHIHSEVGKLSLQWRRTYQRADTGAWMWEMRGGAGIQVPLDLDQWLDAIGVCGGSAMRLVAARSGERSCMVSIS